MIKLVLCRDENQLANSLCSDTDVHEFFSQVLDYKHSLPEAIEIDSEDWIIRQYRGGNVIYLIRNDKDELCGFYILMLYSDEQHRSAAFVSHMFIAQSKRKRGTALEAWNTLEKQLQDLECDYVEGQAHVNNRRSKSFMKWIKAEPASIIYRRCLRDPDKSYANNLYSTEVINYGTSITTAAA